MHAFVQLFHRKNIKLSKYAEYLYHQVLKLKGIVSRDFGGLQMILVNRIGIPDVPLEVYSFLNFRFLIVI